MGRTKKKIDRVSGDQSEDELAPPPPPRQSLPAFSLLSLSFFSSAHTNLDDPASITLAELGHSSEVGGRAQMQEEKRKKSMNQVN